jgi:hypothetical protein
MEAIQDHDVAEVLTAFVRTLSDGQSVEAVFRSMGDYCTELLGVDGIGVLLLRDGLLTVATTNSELGDAAERLETELHEGPCTETIRSGCPVLVPDLAAAVDRFPTFAPRALAAGIGGIHGVPMGTGADRLLGSLNIVTASPRSLSDREVRIAEMLTDVSVSFLVSTRAHEEANEVASQLQQALDSRVVIEQAKGILRGRHGVELDEAFERLRRYARSHNKRIHDVAAEVCTGTLDLP